MQYTTFGATGLTVPRLCLGTATFGHQANETVAHQIMDTAVEAGVTFFDSADIYPMGGEGGRAEEIVGRWLQGKRDQIILATGRPADPWAPPAGSGAAPANICWTPSTAHFTGWAPTTSTSTNSISTTPIRLSTKRWRPSTRSSPPGKHATSACRTFWPTGWPGPQGAQRRCTSPVSRRFNRATTCCSGRSNASCCPWPPKPAWR